MMRVRRSSQLQWLLLVLCGTSHLCAQKKTSLPAAASETDRTLKSGKAERINTDRARSNLVLILTDNHSPWTLGCYGNPDIRTPHLDQLAKEGTLFEHALANNAVCSPTRATLLTGLMPCQHGVHRFLAGGGAQTGPKAYYTLEEFDTLPQILVESGYVAGMCGKWHLGANATPQDGFSHWITKPHGGSAGFYDQEVIENGETRKEPRYLTDLWTDHAVQFIADHKDQPFFLFLPYNGPYGLAPAMREPIHNRHAGFYADRTLPSFPRTKPQPWNHNYGDWIGDLQVIRKYAAEISGIDDGVGRVMEALKEHGLDENTLVVFTSDQGCSGGHAGYWGMGDHTRPLTAFDWGMTIPLILRQPGTVPAGRRVLQMVSNYDLYPTLLTELGLADRIPQSPRSPGRDFGPLLHDQPTDWDEVHYYEFENVRAIRTPQWKYIERVHQEPNELYDLTADPDEHNNLIDNSELDRLRDKLQSRLHAFFGQYADPKWDLWKGGSSKANLTNGAMFGIDNPEQVGRPAVLKKPSIPPR
ncbi:MAG: sulfatase [Planctomycetaceae bacterium]